MQRLLLRSKAMSRHTISLSILGVCIVAVLSLLTVYVLPIAVEPKAQAQSEPTVRPADPNAVSVMKNPSDIPAAITRTTPEHYDLHLTTREVTGVLDDGTTYTYWTFDGTVPGPMLRVRKGDTVTLHLTNDPKSTTPHSIDLHAVTGPGGGAVATQVAPGETKQFTFKAMNEGVYVYHCATPHIPTHISNGMYGLIVVEPEQGL